MNSPMEALPQSNTLREGPQRRVFTLDYLRKFRSYMRNGLQFVDERIVEGAWRLKNRKYTFSCQPPPPPRKRAHLGLTKCVSQGAPPLLTLCKTPTSSKSQRLKKFLLQSFATSCGSIPSDCVALEEMLFYNMPIHSGCLRYISKMKLNSEKDHMH